MVGLRRYYRRQVHRSSGILQRPLPQGPNSQSVSSLKKEEKAAQNAHRIIPRRRLGQRWIILSQFHASPNDNLVQQQRLPLGSIPAVFRVVVGPIWQNRNIRYPFNDSPFDETETNFDEVDEV